MRVARRATVAIAAGAIVGCTSRREPPVAAITYSERSLAYAPLLAAAQAGLYREPPVRVSVLQRSNGRDVAASVVDGSALAGAMALPDFVAAVAEGAPLVVIGALTVRLAAALVVPTEGLRPPPSLGAMLSGAWGGLRVGVERGADGTEALVRLYATRRGGLPPARGPTLVSPEAVTHEPWWIDHPTGESLVAALKDHRIDAFVGRALAAAQAITPGDAEVAVNFAAGDEAEDISAALPTVLVTDQPTAAAGEHSGPAAILEALVPACARAAASLSGPEGVDIVRRALPERDALHLGLALRLAVPAPTRSSFAVSGRLLDGSLDRYLDLSAMAGRTSRVSASALTTLRFIG